MPLEVPLVHVPVGTENLLGRFLGQLPTPQAVAETIDNGVIISLDLGRAGDKIFLLMFSAGFDAEDGQPIAHLREMAARCFVSNRL